MSTWELSVAWELMFPTSSHCLLLAVDSELRCCLLLPARRGKCRCLMLCVQILTGSLDKQLDQCKGGKRSARRRVTMGSRLGCYQLLYIVTAQKQWVPQRKKLTLWDFISTTAFIGIGRNLCVKFCFSIVQNKPWFFRINWAIGPKHIMLKNHEVVIQNYSYFLKCWYITPSILICWHMQ